MKESPIEKIHIPPSPGDAGSADGSAQYLYYIFHKNPRIVENETAKMVRENIYSGPQYQNSEIVEFLNSENIYKKV